MATQGTLDTLTQQMDFPKHIKAAARNVKNILVPQELQESIADRYQAAGSVFDEFKALIYADIICSPLSGLTNIPSQSFFNGLGSLFPSGIIASGAFYGLYPVTSAYTNYKNLPEEDRPPLVKYVKDHYAEGLVSIGAPGLVFETAYFSTFLWFTTKYQEVGLGGQGAQWSEDFAAAALGTLSTGAVFSVATSFLMPGIKGTTQYLTNHKDAVLFHLDKFPAIYEAAHSLFQNL